MVEITALADNLSRVGITPADIAAIGAAFTAAAAAGILTKTALKQIELMRVESSEGTPESRQAKLDAMRGLLKDYLDAMGPEAQAELVKAIAPSLPMIMAAL